MVDKIQTIGKLSKFGNSKGTLFDKKVIDLLDLKVGDYLKLTIEKIEKDVQKKKGE
jgi:hypothetical protein